MRYADSDPNTKQKYSTMTQVAVNMIYLILAIVMNLIPANVTSFTVEGLDEGLTLRCTKQDNGDWLLTDEAGKGDRVAFRVDGTKLTMKEGGKEQTVDLAGHLGIDKDADWSKIKTFNIGGNALAIERKPDGLDLVFQPEKNDDAKQQKIRVRWESDDKPQEPKSGSAKQSQGLN